jgi:hypothetical protein
VFLAGLETLEVGVLCQTSSYRIVIVRTVRMKRRMVLARFRQYVGYPSYYYLNTVNLAVFWMVSNHITKHRHKSESSTR